MAQDASPIPPKGFNNIKINDFWKGLLLAAFSNILLSLYAIINTGAWPTHADLMNMLRATTAIVIAYLLKNYKTNNVGELFKQDKPIVVVSAEKLDTLQAEADDKTVDPGKTN